MITRSTRAVPSLRRAFGEHLRALREARGLSQERLGSKASLSGKFVGEVERGEKSISLDTLWRVARALGLPLGALIPRASRRGNGRRGRKA
jgi:transcriptional regulator with XRE-family HTH domain